VALLHQAGGRGVGGVVVTVDLFMLHEGASDPSGGDDARWPPAVGAGIYERPSGPQRAVRGSEGIDHARAADASEGPGEDGDVETPVTEGRRGGIANYEFHVAQPQRAGAGAR